MIPDKYARDFALWPDWAAINYSASKTLFDTDNATLMFPAATLGHHALEMYLKSALIVKGCIVFDPAKLKKLDPSIPLAARDCAWGHELAKLAKQLHERSPNLDLSKQLPRAGLIGIDEPITLEQGLSIFDPFFSELRYPQKMDRIEGIGFEHCRLLEVLVRE